MPKISTILTSYNKPQWIEQSIKSVIDQTYDDWELLIVDDNSPDKTVEDIILHYVDGKKVRYYQTNVSEEERYKTARYATNINTMANSYASGDFLSYLTDDDYYHPERFEKLLDKLESDPKIKIAYCGQFFVDTDGNVSPGRETFGDIDSAWNLVDHTSVIHEAELFYEVGGWDNDPGTWAGADAYFWNRLTATGNLFYEVAEPLTYKRYHTGSVQWKIHNGQFFPA